MTNQTILLVEDNADDAFFMERAVAKAKVTAPMYVVQDGQEAIDYLSGVGRFADRRQFPPPTIVFMDLKLPYIHGFDVLAWIRDQPHLKSLPVVILTSSAEDRDRDKAEQLNAQGYLVKPPDPATIQEVMRRLRSSNETTADTLSAQGS